MYRRNFLLNLLLAVSLVCAQIGAVTHAVSHFKSAPAQHDQSPADNKACDQCLTYAPVGGGVASAELSFSLPDFIAVLIAGTAYFLFSHIRRYFSSRAPPRPL